MIDQQSEVATKDRHAAALITFPENGGSLPSLAAAMAA
jgi:hypothetical protein